MSTETQADPGTPVFVFNRKPQTVSFPKHKPVRPVQPGEVQDMRLDWIKCRPGFSLSTHGEVSGAGIDTINPHPNTIQLVWIAPTPVPSSAYVTLRDLGEADTLFAIAGTHELKVLDALANATDTLRPVVTESAHARAASIRAGRPSALGRTVARDEGDNYDMGRVA